MTGIYVKVKRGNKYENVELEYLTDDELKGALKGLDNEELIRTIAVFIEKFNHIKDMFQSKNLGKYWNII